MIQLVFFLYFLCPYFFYPPFHQFCFPLSLYLYVDVRMFCFMLLPLSLCLSPFFLSQRWIIVIPDFINVSFHILTFCWIVLRLLSLSLSLSQSIPFYSIRFWSEVLYTGKTYQTQKKTFCHCLWWRKISFSLFLNLNNKKETNSESIVNEEKR